MILQQLLCVKITRFVYGLSEFLHGWYQNNCRVRVIDAKLVDVEQKICVFERMKKLNIPTERKLVQSRK